MQTATLIIGRKRPPRNLKMAELRTAFEDRRPCRQVNSTHPLHLLLPAIINRNRTCGEEGKRSHSVEATVTHATHNTICRQRTGGTHRTPVSIALGGLASLQPSQKSRLPALSHVPRRVRVPHFCRILGTQVATVVWGDRYQRSGFLIKCTNP